MTFLTPARGHEEASKEHARIRPRAVDLYGGLTLPTVGERVFLLTKHCNSFACLPLSKLFSPPTSKFKTIFHYHLLFSRYGDGPAPIYRLRTGFYFRLSVSTITLKNDEFNATRAAFGSGSDGTSSIFGEYKDWDDVSPPWQAGSKPTWASPGSGDQPAVR